MPKPVILDSFSWPTRAAAEEYFQTILRRSGYLLGDVISDVDHQQALLELLERHPDVEDKSRGGVKNFYIGRTRDGGRVNVSADAIGIWIERQDGTKVDFSYITAIRQPSQEVNVKEALRFAVADIRQMYRDARFAAGTAMSDLSGSPIESRELGHVIYLDPSWHELTEGFAAGEGGWDRIAISHGSGGIQIGGAVDSPDQLARWRDYHARSAAMGIATASEAARRPRS